MICRVNNSCRLFGVSGLLLAFLLCRLFAKNWNPLLPGVCVLDSASILAGGSINTITNFDVIALPMPMIWCLQMAPQRKIGLTVLFGLGLGLM